ncbi:hypothetical protein ONS96_005018 [Cadophora gregata f. sp. sojae]|nr:hypothetical protein ONS96_005018 [Cadophora gregata f. sp. sojae]
MDCFKILPHSFIRRHITLKKSSSPQQEKDVAIPSPTPSLRQRTVSPSRPRITASSIPQWTWTNAHCKAWIYEVCVVQLRYTSQNAEAICNKFTGFGTTLYTMDRTDWEALLGLYNGMGIYSIILSLKHHADAVMEGIYMPLENGNNNNGNGIGKEETKSRRRSWRKNV